MTLEIFHTVFEPQTLEQSLDGACAPVGLRYSSI